MLRLLPYRTFLRTFRYVPRLAVSLVIRNRQGAVLLTRRAIPPSPGSWHMPGGFLLKGETIRQCIKRIFQRELNSGLRKNRCVFFDGR
ncbi:MAG: NUDIX domain-containing protein [Candidatus Liptonbacteria bacterium]|nr:NUDIX domain-containing protein [Candidatus Liptonbacteria bacterium]